MSQSHQTPAPATSKPLQHGVSLDALLPECAGDNVGVHFAQSCASDAARVQPGDVFVAVDDGGQDGHERAREAVARGASAVICERAVPVFNAPVYTVEDSRIALGRLCQALVGNPSQSLRVVAVVGTHGKSTTIALLESIFKAADLDVGVVSTFKTYDGMTRAAGVGESPSPSFLASRLAAMEAAGCSHALVEVTAESLAQHRFAGIEFDAVCATQVTSADLDKFHTPENYRRINEQALDQLSAEGVAVLNADDPVCCRWTGNLAAPTLMYGTQAAAQITAQVIECNACQQTFVLSIGNESAAVRTNVVGEHHVQNCLAAAAVAFAYGVPLAKIARGLELLAKLPGRMQRVDRGQAFPVFVDAAGSPEALRSSLRTARQLSAGRVICVLGDEASRDANENTAVELVVRKLADVAIVTDRLAASTAWSDQPHADLAVQTAVDRDEAIQWAVELAVAGDVVVVAGSQDGPTVEFGRRTASDAETVAEHLLSCEPQPALRLVA